MDTKVVDYVDGELRLHGYLASPPGRAKSPGVLVAHDAMGVREHFHAQARWLASLGYAGFALDLFGRPPARPEEGFELCRTLEANSHVLQRRVQAAVGALRSSADIDPERLAIVGYCFGGTVALELARSGAPLRAAVCVHGGLLPLHPDTTAALKAKILVCTGSVDPIVPFDQRRAFELEMTAACADWQLQLLGGARHAFSMPEADRLGAPGVGYHASADRRSRGLIEQFLSEVL